MAAAAIAIGGPAHSEPVKINIFAIFALSISLVIGQAGIGTLGQAAMFGVGSYAAAPWSLRVGSDPRMGLLVGAAAGAITAPLSGLLVLRTRGLTLIMLTVAFARSIPCIRPHMLALVSSGRFRSAACAVISASSTTLLCRSFKGAAGL